jgi:predicted transcriptional regulator of viral defense system
VSPHHWGLGLRGRELELIDALVAEGREEFTFKEATVALGRSPTSTANALRQILEKGLIDRVARGCYAIRPLGSIGTSTATDDLPLAVAAAFGAREHRIAYLSALSELGLLVHPVRTVFVACAEQVRMPTVSRRRLRVVVEHAHTIHLEAEPVGRSWRSTVERALFECALRVDLVGSVERLAEAIASGSREAHADRITRLAHTFGPRGFAAERRLASLARALDLPLALNPQVDRRRPVIRLDPREDRVEWIDETLRVAWNRTVEEVRAVVEN